MGTQRRWCLSCTLETYMVLWTNVTPINLIFKKEDMLSSYKNLLSNQPFLMGEKMRPLKVFSSEIFTCIAVLQVKAFKKRQKIPSTVEKKIFNLSPVIFKAIQTYFPFLKLIHPRHTPIFKVCIVLIGSIVESLSNLQSSKTDGFFATHMTSATSIGDFPQSLPWEGPTYRDPCTFQGHWVYLWRVLNF